jgi:hypothetical protein
MIQLTICLPTRNRQSYCIETIRALAVSDRDDFEVIVGDNSDDGTILSDFFAQDFHDPRFELVGPQDGVLAMVDNWERLVELAKGRWISVIGDDDYLDPNLSALLKHYERLHPEVESVGWSRMNFNWPDNRVLSTLSTIPVSHDTFIAVKSRLQDQLYRWSERKRVPAGGFGAYHGAVRKSLMERIKRKFGGRYFEHPVVDFESVCKTIREAKMLVHCQRPFSVLGAGAASNSAGTQSQKVLVERARTFKRETVGKVDMDDPVFPFPISDKGAALSASIASTTFWFCRTYGVDLTGFPENFAQAAADELRYARSEADFEAKKAFFERGFDTWDGGKWRDHFKPGAFQPNISFNELSGVIKDMLYVREEVVPSKTPADFYRFAEHAILPAEIVASGARAFAR